MYNRLIIIY